MSDQPSALQVLAQIAEGVGAAQEQGSAISAQLKDIAARVEANERGLSDHRLEMAPVLERRATVAAILAAEQVRLERENTAAALQTSRLQAAGDSMKELIGSKWGTLLLLVATAALSRWYPEISGLLTPGTTP